MVKVVREISSAPTEIDTVTGKESPRPIGWKLPPAEHCQICAAKHDPSEPHNAQSLYYQTVFNGQVGRTATWADAMAHCDAPVRLAWETALRRMGHWNEPPAGEQPVKHHGVEGCVS